MKERTYQQSGKIHKNFPSKIKGLEDVDYHVQLKKLGLYSKERRCEMFIIINAWQQMEDIRKNVLNLKTERVGIPSLPFQREYF